MDGDKIPTMMANIFAAREPTDRHVNSCAVRVDAVGFFSLLS